LIRTLRQLRMPARSSGLAIKQIGLTQALAA
jgi:hypothetical protein